MTKIYRDFSFFQLFGRDTMITEGLSLTRWMKQVDWMYEGEELLKAGFIFGGLKSFNFSEFVYSVTN